MRHSTSGCLLILVFLLLSPGPAVSISQHSTEGMVFIPAGKFTMGISKIQQHIFAKQYLVNPDIFEIRPQREDMVFAFYIDRHEVTIGKYRKFLDATGHRVPIIWLEHGLPTGMDNYPVTGVDYEDAEAYAKWAGKRLPTDVEWEKAARGSDGRTWPWGNRWEPGACNADRGGPAAMITRPAPVGSHPRDQSVFGIYDMAGNVMEWVHYKKTEGLARGGSFAQAEPWQFSCDARVIHPTNHGGLGYIGFRCAMDAEAVSRPSSRPASRPAADVSTDSGSWLARARQPGAALIGSRSIQVFPVHDLDPGREKYLNAMFHYVGDRSEEKLAVGDAVPWRFEARVPYMPDDRFTFFFEAQYQRPMEELWFNDDFTEVRVQTDPTGIESRVVIKCGRDYIDIEIQAINHTDQDHHTTMEICFQPLWAPNFRDHDGSRTYMLTDKGFRSTNQINHRVMERFWCQQYLVEKPPGGGYDGAPVLNGSMVALVSRDHQWAVSPSSISDRPYRLFNNWEYSCIHSNPISDVKAGNIRKSRQRIYFHHGDLKSLADRYKNDAEFKVKYIEQAEHP
jgi:formylglycine-generating enzyme required for sulfatase activity